MATTINASTSAGLVSTADTSGVLQLQTAGTTVLNAELGKALALQGATSTTGCGIAFPATQVTSTDVNTLDDYEEGTWTPSLGGTATYTTQTGTYTKIGRLVHVSCYLTVSAIGTGSQTQITGLPFNINLSNNDNGCTVGYVNGCANSYVSMGFDNYITTININARTAASTSSGGSPVFTSGTTVSMHMVYIT